MGTPVEAFSVGSSASWKVNGSGIGSTHAYLFFDGRTLFVACAPGAIVKLQGAVVSTDWRPVTVPAEIELGGVVLGVASQRGGGAAASAGPSRGHAPLSQRGAARPSGGGRRPLPSASGAPAARQPAQHRPRLQEMPHGQGQSTAPQYAR
ncbi:MAG TPA: hypothetical protein PKA88_26415, partial [Polyangiaceae bacterium]|nr:hypothetical protein [Polyangiaceae bacterium]